jgi:hypothetical protein
MRFSLPLIPYEVVISTAVERRSAPWRLTIRRLMIALVLLAIPLAWCAHNARMARMYYTHFSRLHRERLGDRDKLLAGVEKARGAGDAGEAARLANLARREEAFASQFMAEAAGYRIRMARPWQAVPDSPRAYWRPGKGPLAGVPFVYMPSRDLSQQR